MERFDTIDIFFIALIGGYFLTLFCILITIIIKTICRVSKNKKENLSVVDVKEKIEVPKEKVTKTKKTKEKHEFSKAFVAIIHKLFMKKVENRETEKRKVLEPVTIKLDETKRINEEEKISNAKKEQLSFDRLLDDLKEEPELELEKLPLEPIKEENKPEILVPKEATKQNSNKPKPKNSSNTGKKSTNSPKSNSHKSKTNTTKKKNTPKSTPKKATSAKKKTTTTVKKVSNNNKPKEQNKNTKTAKPSNTSKKSTNKEGTKKKSNTKNHQNSKPKAKK